MFCISDLIEVIDHRSEGKLTSTPINGAQTRSVTRFAPLESATEEHIAFVAQSKYREAAKTSRAGVVVLTQADLDAIDPQAEQTRAWIVTPNPYAWFAWALQVMTAASAPQAGVSAQAHVHDTAQIDPTAIVEAGAVVQAGARVGARTHLYPGAFVGEGTQVGDDCILYPNAVVYHGCTIGSRVILHAGCVIGADGFGFAPFAGQWVKIPQVGGVRIGDDVEIGANTTIDRGALDDTVVGAGSKIDNQIQLGHNCRVGEHTVMAACTGVAGSTRIGNHCIIGGAANINGHITIPDGAMVGPATSLTSWDPKARQMVGFFPAQPQREFERSAVLVRQLPKLREKMRALQAQIDALQAKIDA